MISLRIDEFNNRTDYDHRNILFKRYKLFTYRNELRLNGTIELLSNGTVMAWGKNDLGQLGIGNYVNQLVPTLISNLSNIIGLSAGSAHTLALVNDGTLRSWGYNNRGQLGNNTTTNSNIPIDVRNSTNTGDILTKIKIDKLIYANIILTQL